MESVIRALTQLIDAGDALDAERECRVDTSGAPACIQELVATMRTHAWRVQLGEYRINDNGSGRMFDLGVVFEILEDLDSELDEALAHAGADGGALDPRATLQLGPDGGGMSTLGLSWSGGRLSFVVVEMEEDPNEDGLVKHFNTPGALFEYLDNYLEPDDEDGHVAALKEAAIAAGDSMDPAAPVESKAPVGAAPREPAPPPAKPIPSLQTLIAELQAAIDTDDAATVDSALGRLEGPISNPALLIPYVFLTFYNARDAHPATALKAAHWLSTQRAPIDLMARAEFLKGLSGGCELAIKPGDEAMRYAVIQHALPYAGEKHDILHNAACALCELGRSDEVLEAVTKAAALGYAGLQDLRTDQDIVRLCGQEAVDAAIARAK